MLSCIRRLLTVSPIVVLVAGGALAAASAGSRGAVAPSKPHLRERRILAIALKAAAAAGDSTPTLIQHSESSRYRANLVDSGDIVPGSQWSYVIAERGHFTLNDASVPSGAQAPRGTVLTLIVSARTGQVTDDGLSNRYPDLAKLGKVYTDRSPLTGRGSSYGIDIQAIYDQNGNPLIGANFRPKANLASPSWETCPPPNASTCTPASTDAQSLEPGPSPAGTVFQATATYEGHTYTARSAVWLGQVRAIHRPRLEGRPQTGSMVMAKPARWHGGWRPDPGYKPQLGAMSGGRLPAFDFLSVEACRTKSASRCINLTAGGSSRASAQQPVRVTRRFIGWYLFAFDERLPADTVFDAPAYGSPGAVPPLKLGPTVGRSGPSGPVRS
jgi:hypothetical protein